MISTVDERTIAWIIGVTAAIILTLILLIILFFTVRTRITIETKEEKIYLTLWLFGVRIPILPRKPKKYRLSRYTKKKIAKRDQREALKKAKKAEKKAKEKKEQQTKKKTTPKKPQEKKKGQVFEDFKTFYKQFVPSPSDSVDYLVGLIRFFFPSILSRAHFHAARIRIKVGGPDAATIALKSTAICGALGAALLFIERHSNLHGCKRADINISPDYLSEETKYDVKLGFSMSLGGISFVMIRSMIRIILGYLKIKPKGETAESSSPIKRSMDASVESKTNTVSPNTTK